MTSVKQPRGKKQTATKTNKHLQAPTRLNTLIYRGYICHNLGMIVLNCVCHGHECNILFITVELLN